jgi:hypothetical protein
MAIVSVSRRTDIPAFYSEWFINRIYEGYVLYPLPYSDKLKHLELTPEKVDCFVFWSKNYEHLIPYIDLLDSRGFNYYFHFTINNYPEYFEKNVIPSHEAIKQASIISKKKSPDHVLWRYDPIIITRDLSINYHLYNFESLAEKLQGYTKRCYIEFLCMYKKVERNFHTGDIHTIPLSQEHKISIASRMAKIAANYGIQLYSC